MKYKVVELDGKNYIELDEEGKNPVVIGEDGKEFPVDAIHLLAKIPELNAESKKHREAREAMEAELAKYKDIDPEKAKEAMEKLKDVDFDNLVQKGKIDEIKSEIKQAYEEKMKTASEAYEEKLKEYEAEIENGKKNVRTLLISNSFAGSSYIKEKTTFPTAATAEAFLGKFFRIEENRVIASYPDGRDIISRTKPPELAPFEEAVQLLIENHPDRESFLKAAQTKGSGGGQGSNKLNLAGLSPAEKLKMIRRNQK